VSLGRKLSFHARATLGSHDGGMASPWRQHEPIAGPHREALAVSKDEIDRAARAVENLRVTVLVLAVGVPRRVRPSIYVTGFAPDGGLDRAGIRWHIPAMATMFDLH
jgi:hypothetical protein